MMAEPNEPDTPYRDAAIAASRLAHARESLVSLAINLALDVERFRAKGRATDQDIMLAWDALTIVQRFMWFLTDEPRERQEWASRRATLEGLGEGYGAAAKLQGEFNQLVEKIKEGQAPAIKRLLEERDLARRARRFGDADVLREELRKLGVVIADGADGTSWHYAGDWFGAYGVMPPAKHEGPE